MTPVYTQVMFWLPMVTVFAFLYIRHTWTFKPFDCPDCGQQRYRKAHCTQCGTISETPSRHENNNRRSHGRHRRSTVRFR